MISWLLQFIFETTDCEKCVLIYKYTKALAGLCAGRLQPLVEYG